MFNPRRSQVSQLLRYPPLPVASGRTFRLSSRVAQSRWRAQN